MTKIFVIFGFLALFLTKLEASVILDKIVEYVVSGIEPDKKLVNTALQELTDEPKRTLGYVALVDESIFYANGVKLGSMSRWNHVALILCEPKDIISIDAGKEELEKIDKTNWLCFESHPFLGDLHLVPWSTFIANEKDNHLLKADISLRPFLYERDSKMPESEQIAPIVSQYLGMPYKKSGKELFYSIIRANTTNDKSSIFCAELSALLLQELGILPDGPSDSRYMLANNFIPADFSEMRPNALQLNKVTLGKEIPVIVNNRGIIRKTYNSFLCWLGFIRGWALGGR
jgi:hypothetical protein